MGGNIRQFHIGIAYILNASSVLSNLFLVMLSVNKCGYQMRKYRPILCLTAWTNILFSFTNTFAVVTINVSERHIFLLNSGFLENVGNPISGILTTSWFFLTYTRLTMALMFFVVRYGFICRPKKKLQTTIILCFLEAFNFATCISLAMAFDDDGKLMFRSILRKIGGIYPSSVAFNVVSLKDPFHSIHLCLLCVLTFGDYCIMAVMSNQCYKTLQENRLNMGMSTLRFHTQLNKLMVFLGTAPFLTLIFPTMVRIVAVYAWPGDLYTPILTSIFESSLPTVDAVMTIYLIPSFRRAVRKMLRLRNPTAAESTNEICEASLRFPGGVFGILGLLEAMNCILFGLLIASFDNGNKFTYHRLLQANGIDLPFGVWFHVADASSRIYTVHVFVALFHIILNFSLIAYCARQTWKTLQITKVRMGITTLTFHSQLHKILGYMCTYLILMLLIPGGLRIFEANFLDLPSTRIGIITSLFSSTLPLVNAWMIIFLIPSFRRSVLPVLRNSLCPREVKSDTVLTVRENKA
ncbi:unnamed protein product [Bursaphelenchus xylophilus]|uniref:(pine wood nematode) hypothetical protein n=1 Tax=Bursaphelenchus xylophilus TaxID=6326 RepID=A0A1I7S5I8_BURXY|nr:unnamed protein product [Bursaphelenchus xylophilus]CAG9124754.1 unnamed protein product [Bursaphelenchus xylophilus]